MKKRLHKAMPRVPLLKLRPELSGEVIYDRESMESIENQDAMDGQDDNEANMIIPIYTRFLRMFFCMRNSGNDEMRLVEM